MSVTKQRSGRYRAQVWSDGRWIPVADVIGGDRSFATKKAAQAAKRRAQIALEDRRDTPTPGRAITIGQFYRKWTTDPLFARPKESTNVHNAERTLAFCEKYGSVPVRDLGTARGDAIVAEWLAGGKRNGTVQALRAMFNDAASAKGGRLLDRNPFAGLGIGKGKGNKDKAPPTQDEMERFIGLAYELTPPSFAAYLEFACVTGARPGELDALRTDRVDLVAGEAHIAEQWNVKVSKFTTPKYGEYTIALPSRARDVILRIPRDETSAASPFVFTTLRGTHYTPSSRTHHWNRVRAAAGLGSTTLYLATRHYFGWYALNILELPAHVIADQLGHKDGGKLVLQLYGHPDKKISRAKVRDAFDGAATVTPLRLVREGA